MLNLPVMVTRGFRAALLLVLLSGCATAVPDHQLPPDGLVWSPEGPFSKDTKAVIPDEASAFNHFLKGQLLLIDGEFEPALKEFEAATQASPTDGFLHFRLAQLYLRRGEVGGQVGTQERRLPFAPGGALFRGRRQSKGAGGIQRGLEARSEEPGSAALCRGLIPASRRSRAGNPAFR